MSSPKKHKWGEIQFKDAHTQILASYKCPEIAQPSTSPCSSYRSGQLEASWYPLPLCQCSHQDLSLDSQAEEGWTKAQLSMVSPLQKVSLLEGHKEVGTTSLPFPLSTSHPRVPLFLVLQGAPSKLEISTLSPELWLLSWHVEEKRSSFSKDNSKAKKARFYFSIKLSWDIDDLSHSVWVEWRLMPLAEEKWEMESTLEMLPSEQSWQETRSSALVESLPKGLLDLQGFSELCGCKAKSSDTRTDRKICLRIFASLSCFNLISSKWFIFPSLLSFGCGLLKSRPVLWLILLSPLMLENSLLLK